MIPFKFIRISQNCRRKCYYIMFQALKGKFSSWHRFNLWVRFKWKIAAILNKHIQRYLAYKRWRNKCVLFGNHVHCCAATCLIKQSDKTNITRRKKNVHQKQHTKNNRDKFFFFWFLGHRITERALLNFANDSYARNCRDALAHVHNSIIWTKLNYRLIEINYVLSIYYQFKLWHN